MNLPTSAPLTEADFDRLESLLQQDLFDDEAMLLDELQGLLCAIVSAPDPIPASRWMPVALGVSPKWVSPQQAEDAKALVTRLHDDISRSLASGEGVELILYPREGTENVDYRPWAQGYLEGVNLADPPWESHGDPDDVDELLFPFLILAGAMEEDEALRKEMGLTRAQAARLIDDCEAELPDAVLEVYGHWHA